MQAFQKTQDHEQDDSTVQLRRVVANTPVVAREWGTLPITSVQAHCMDIVSSAHLRDTLPPGERDDCAMMNTLFDVWRERGLEKMPGLSLDGRFCKEPAAMCAPCLHVQGCI
jgi:hypothetical protein